MKGQIHSSVITYFIIAIVLAITIFAGTKWISGISQSACRAEIIQFKTALQQGVNAMAFEEGSITEKKLKPPCDFEKIIFVDKEKDILFASLDNYQIIKESIETNQDKNLFMIRKGRVEEMDYIENLDLKVPYFLCSNTAKNIMPVQFQGRSEGTNIEVPDEVMDCTFDYALPIELAEEDLTLLLESILDGGQQIENLIDPVEVNLTRQVSYVGGVTTITIRKDDLTELDYYESIPKCIIESLSAAEDNDYIDVDYDLNVSDDPLIMWHFGANVQQKEYTVNKLISRSCLRGLSPGLIGVALTDQTFEEQLDGMLPHSVNVASFLSDLEEDIADLNYEQIDSQKIAEIIGYDEDSDIIKKIVNHYRTQKRRQQTNIPPIQATQAEFIQNTQSQSQTQVNAMLDDLRHQLMTLLAEDPDGEIIGGPDLIDEIILDIQENELDDAIDELENILEDLRGSQNTQRRVITAMIRHLNRLNNLQDEDNE